MTGIRCQFLVLRPGWWCQGWRLGQSTSSVCWLKTNWARAHSVKLLQSPLQVGTANQRMFQLCLLLFDFRINPLSCTETLFLILDYQYNQTQCGIYCPLVMVKLILSYAQLYCLNVNAVHRFPDEIQSNVIFFAATVAVQVYLSPTLQFLSLLYYVMQATLLVEVVGHDCPLICILVTFNVILETLCSTKCNSQLVRLFVCFIVEMKCILNP